MSCCTKRETGFKINSGPEEDSSSELRCLKCGVFPSFHLKLVNRGLPNENEKVVSLSLSLSFPSPLDLWPYYEQAVKCARRRGRVRLIHSASAQTDCCAIYELITNLILIYSSSRGQLVYFQRREKPSRNLTLKDCSREEGTTLV